MDTRWTQDGHKMDTRWTQNGHKMDTKWTQKGHKMDTKWTENGRKTANKWTKLKQSRRKMNKMNKTGTEPKMLFQAMQEKFHFVFWNPH